MSERRAIYRNLAQHALRPELRAAWTGSMMDGYTLDDLTPEARADIIRGACVRLFEQIEDRNAGFIEVGVQDVRTILDALDLKS